MNLTLALSALGILIGVLIGMLPMTLAYSAGRGWISAGYVFMWPLAVGGGAVISRILLLTLARKSGRKSATLAIVAMLGATSVCAIGAWVNCMNSFMTGFQHAIEARISPAAFQSWAETTGRRIAADTNTTPSSDVLPNGLATIFPSRPYLSVQAMGDTSDADILIRVRYGGGHWHWSLSYFSPRTNDVRSTSGLGRILGHGVSLATD